MVVDQDMFLLMTCISMYIMSDQFLLVSIFLDLYNLNYSHTYEFNEMSSFPVRIQNHISRDIQFRGNTQCDTNLMQTESEWNFVTKRLQSTHYIPMLLTLTLWYCFFLLFLAFFILIIFVHWYGRQGKS